MSALCVSSWLVFCAAFSAGAINSIAGGGTLITFPVLIWLGLDPKVANGTSTVALWPGLFGGLFGYRKELENSSTILFRLGLTSVVGGAIGAWLLIWTPSPVFASLVPFLILFATVLFMAQERSTSASAWDRSMEHGAAFGGPARSFSSSSPRCTADISAPATAY